MAERLKKYLQTIKKKTISIDDLQSFAATENIPYLIYEKLEAK